MQFKNILTSFALAAVLAVPSVSSAMTTEKTNDSLATINQLIELAQSMLSEVSLDTVKASPLTSGSIVLNDANRDGSVNQDDLAYINEAVTGPVAGTDYSSADINGDGKIDKKDFFALRTHFKNADDYVNVYDSPTIGAGWTIVPADGVIDEKDENALKFALYVYAVNNDNYALYADYNFDGKVDQKDADIMLDYIENGAPEVPTVKPAAVAPTVKSISPNRVDTGAGTKVKITGDLEGLHSLVLNGAKARTYIIADFEGDSSEVEIVIPDNVVIGDYNVQLLFLSQPNSIDGGTITVFDSSPDAPVVKVSFPRTELAAGTTNANLIVSTDIAAKCSYSKNAGTAYTSMTPFSVNGVGTDENIYFQSVSGLQKNVQINYYVKCKPSAGAVMMTDHVIKFSAGKVS